MSTPVLDPPLDVDTIAGRFAVGLGDVIHAVQGLPGFEACRRYVLVTTPSLGPFTCLHGLDAPHPSFLTIDPRRVDPGYHCPLSKAERARLGGADSDVLLWLAVVHVDGARMSVNLRAPIVVHPARMTALQLLGADTAYTTSHPLTD